MRFWLNYQLLLKCLATPAVLILILAFLLTGQNPPRSTAAQVTLRYMGTAAWEITDGNTIILIDPYLSRRTARSRPDGLRFRELRKINGHSMDGQT